MATGLRHSSSTHPEILKRGEKHWKSKLTDELVREIRTSYSRGGTTLKMLAAKYGVSFANIGKIVTRKNWRHIR